MSKHLMWRNFWKFEVTKLNLGVKYEGPNVSNKNEGPNVNLLLLQFASDQA